MCILSWRKMKNHCWMNRKRCYIYSEGGQNDNVAFQFPYFHISQGLWRKNLIDSKDGEREGKK